MTAAFQSGAFQSSAFQIVPVAATFPAHFYEDDLPDFFDVEEFADEALYLTLGSIAAPVPINVLFDAPGTIVLDGIGVETVSPKATCRLVDVPDAQHGDTLTIRGVAYTAQGVDPDGTGIVVLRLEAPS